jgi:hypothetical protein
VSTLRKLFVKLIDLNDSKNRAISDLEKLIASTKAELEEARHTRAKEQPTPSVVTRQEVVKPTERNVAPSDITKANSHATGSVQDMLYSEVVGTIYVYKQKRYTLIVTSKESKSTETIREILKAKINPTEIKVEISSLKTLRNGKVQIETSSNEEVETLTRNINDRCGKELEANAHKMRNPVLVLYNIPEEISTQNIEEIMIAQNPELNLKVGVIKPKFVYETRKRTRNLVIEVSAQTRTILIQKKIKLGWIVCGLSDYLVTKRCFKCCKFNHSVPA